MEGAFAQRWQERVELDNAELAKEIQRRFEAARTDVALPFSLMATYLISFAGRLALPYAVGVDVLRSLQWCVAAMLDATPGG